MQKNRTSIRIAGQSVRERFVRAAGPQRQNPRHEASAVELRLNLPQAALAEVVKQRLADLAPSQITKRGELVIRAVRSTSQARNRLAARQRLAALLRRASQPTVAREEHEVPSSSREARLADKHLRGARKRARRTPSRRSS